MKEKQAIQILSTLAQETRLGIVRYLIECGEQGSSAGEISKHLDASPSRTSFHLSALEQAGVISSEKQSRYVIYHANTKNLGGLVSFLLNDCCGSNIDILKCAKS